MAFDLKKLFAGKAGPDPAMIESYVRRLQRTGIADDLPPDNLKLAIIDAFTAPEAEIEIENFLQNIRDEDFYALTNFYEEMLAYGAERPDRFAASFKDFLGLDKTVLSDVEKLLADTGGHQPHLKKDFEEKVRKTLYAKGGLPAIRQMFEDVQAKVEELRDDDSAAIRKIFWFQEAINRAGAKFVSQDAFTIIKPDVLGAIAANAIKDTDTLERVTLECRSTGMRTGKIVKDLLEWENRL